MKWTQMVARTVLDTLRQVSENATDVGTVFEIVSRLAQDVEPSVRAELMEQVPHIAMYCQELPESLHYVVPLHLLPLVVKFLTDTNNQVRIPNISNIICDTFFRFEKRARRLYWSFLSRGS